MCDLLGDVTLLPEEVSKYAVIEFLAFSKRQEVEVLTDNLEALEQLYVDAYEVMYRQRYAEVIDHLAKMALERKNCAD